MEKNSKYVKGPRTLFERLDDALMGRPYTLREHPNGIVVVRKRPGITSAIEESKNNPKMHN